MRTFKRLLPVLVLVTLTSVVLAVPCGRAGNSYTPGVALATPQLGSVSYVHPDPQIYFGTVVRDTSDEQSVVPGRGELPPILQSQIPMGMSARVSLLARIWVFYLMVPK